MEGIGSLTPPQDLSRKLGYAAQIVLLAYALLVLARVSLVSSKRTWYLTMIRKQKLRFSLNYAKYLDLGMHHGRISS